MAASVRQIEANRRNAAGPHQMTEVGKQSVRVNALRHGLTTRLHVVLPDEDLSFYNQILKSLQAEYAPVNTQEEMLVNLISQHYWRLIRVRNMETGAFKLGVVNLSNRCGIDPIQPDDINRGGHLSTVMDLNEGVFTKLNRYEASIERSYYRAIRELERKQAARPRADAATTEVDPEPVTRTAKEIRSVSQSAQAVPATPEHFRSVSSNALSDDLEPPATKEINQQPAQNRAATDGAAHRIQSST